MAVVVRVAERRGAALVLVEVLHVVDAAGGGCGDLVPDGLDGEVTGWAEVVAEALSAESVADVGEHLAAWAEAHFGGEVFALELVAAVVGGVNHAALRPADAGAVEPDAVSALVHGVDELAHLVFAAIGGPDVGGRPGCRSFPVHEQRHELAFPELAVFFDDGEDVGVGIVFVGMDAAGVESVALDGVGEDDRRVGEPFGEPVFEGFGEGGVAGLRPVAVDECGVLPVAVEGDGADSVGR